MFFLFRDQGGFYYSSVNRISERTEALTLEFTLTDTTEDGWDYMCAVTAGSTP